MTTKIRKRDSADYQQGKVCNFLRNGDAQAPPEKRQTFYHADTPRPTAMFWATQTPPGNSGAMATQQDTSQKTTNEEKAEENEMGGKNTTQPGDRPNTRLRGKTQR